MVSIIHCLVRWLTEASGVQEANMLLGALNQPVSTVADQVMGHLRVNYK